MEDSLCTTPVEFDVVEGGWGVLAYAVSCVLVVAPRSLSKFDRSRKYNNNNNNNKIIVINIIRIVCQCISVCDNHEVCCMCYKESTSIECRGVTRWVCKLSSDCNVGGVSSCSWWDSFRDSIGTLYGRKIIGVWSSVCIDPRSVGYISKSSVDTWQAVALNSIPAFTSTCVQGELASLSGQRNVSYRGVNKCYTYTYSCRIIFDCW
jgi:hypothetical protein